MTIDDTARELLEPQQQQYFVFCRLDTFLQETSSARKKNQKLTETTQPCRSMYLVCSILYESLYLNQDLEAPIYNPRTHVEKQSSHPFLRFHVSVICC